MTSPTPIEGRCNAQCRDGGHCENYPIGGRDRCRMHGGKHPRAEKSPHFEHGLFSDYLGKEDREAVDALADVENADKLEHIINWRLARLRRAVRHLNDTDDESDEANFWEAFAELANKTEAPEAGEIRELAGLLDSGNRAMQREVDLVRKCIKDFHKIAEGETVTHEVPGIAIHTEAGDGNDG